jgi:hypothetical protein
MGEKGGEFVFLAAIKQQQKKPKSGPIKTIYENYPALCVWLLHFSVSPLLL